PGHGLQAVVVPIPEALLRQRKRCPCVDIARRKVECLRQDADDRERLAVEPNHLSDDGGVAGELRLPEGVAQHDGWVAEAIDRRDRAAELRPYAEQWHEIEA